MKTLRLLSILLFACGALLGAEPADGKVRADATVALDGSGQFTSLQEAISAAPMRTDPSSPRWVIAVKPGTYTERVYVQRERGHIHVLGEDAATTRITYNLHANLLGPDGKIIGTFRTPTVQIDGDGMLWENITIANHAGPVGQALALRADGDRLVFRGCRFLGWQDTVLLNRGRHLFENCYIEGHVDFIFGAATAFFDRCSLHVLGEGYITAASTPKDQPQGFVFADCKITGEPGVKTYLGRPWRDFAKTIFVRTEMSDAVRPEGWDNWNKPDAEQTTFYAEFGSTGPGASANTRVPWAKTLTAEDVSELTATKVLAGADHWKPILSDTSTPVRDQLHIVLVGDSTVTDQAGWGHGFKQLLASNVECSNTALGGRSSKSFREEGHWQPALALRGDFYLIQFGHNDQPGKGPARETDPLTTYVENMARYVDDVRAIGGQPILVTSLTRRDFDPSGRITGTLGPYVAAVRKVAIEKNVPLVDLNARSVELCERLGPEKCEAFNPKTATGTPDRTHLEAKGSLVFARLVADELRRVAPALAGHLENMPSHAP